MYLRQVVFQLKFKQNSSTADGWMDAGLAEIYNHIEKSENSPFFIRENVILAHFPFSI